MYFNCNNQNKYEHSKGKQPNYITRGLNVKKNIYIQKTPIEKI